MIYWFAVVFLGGMAIGGYLTKWAINREEDLVGKEWEASHPLHANFLNYCDSAPQLRFWQALALWSARHVLVLPVDFSPIHLKMPDGLKSIEARTALIDTYYSKSQDGN